MASLRGKVYLIGIITSAMSLAYATGCGSSLPPNITPGSDSVIAHLGNESTGGLNRTYRIFVPDGYNTTIPVPLVLSFHGRSQSGSDEEKLTGLSDVFYNNATSPFIAVYPEGEIAPGTRVRQWQGDPDASPDVDDVAFVSGLIDALTDSYCIDTSKVYACGKSNGGGLVNLLACNATTSGKIAAFAPVSAAIYLGVPNGYSNTSCAPNSTRGPIPMLEFHGFKDPIANYSGGDRRGEETINIPNWIDSWASNDMCCPNTTETLCKHSGYPHVTHYSWTCSGVDELVQHYNISNLAHDWPSTGANLDNKGDVDHETCFNATSKILDFFAQHTLSINGSATRVNEISSTSIGTSGSINHLLSASASAAKTFGSYMNQHFLAAPH